MINSELDTLRQCNKILKIADRHGWDAVNKYLDDPLADNNEDASKLRGAIVRAGRKRERPASKIQADLTQRTFFVDSAKLLQSKTNSTHQTHQISPVSTVRDLDILQESAHSSYVQRPNPPQQLQQPCHQHNLNLC